MKVTIEGNQKEIAGFVAKLQKQQSQKPEYAIVREPYSCNYKVGKVESGCGEIWESAKPKEAPKILMDWRRFELITDNPQEIENLEFCLVQKNITKQDLAQILFSLRVRSGFAKSDFDI